ncbi:hypothetical protein HDU97_009169 [Phlyctochytrium planicorne]|nr:hypothetical protein HDU97_009169 [Phlyctochytrium planicorne]
MKNRSARASETVRTAPYSKDAKAKDSPASKPKAVASASKKSNEIDMIFSKKATMQPKPDEQLVEKVEEKDKSHEKSKVKGKKEVETVTFSDKPEGGASTKSAKPTIPDEDGFADSRGLKAKSNWHMRVK